MDAEAWRRANQLVGNHEPKPSVEILLGGAEFRVLRPCRLAIAGPGGFPGGSSFVARRFQAGETLRIGPAAEGVWSYLAVGGGFSGPEFLGSISAYPRGGVGGILGVGSVLKAGPASSVQPHPSLGDSYLPEGERPDYSIAPVIRLWPGPQWEWFPEASRQTFLQTEWSVSSRSDRVGYRLEGARLEVPGGELISEPVLPGAIQVPPGGEPVVLMRDAPTIGGYPKIAIVEPEDLSRLAQVGPGSRLRWEFQNED